MKIFDKINFKHEAWKYSPKVSLKNELSFEKGDFINDTFYMGPDEETLTAQNWSDLEAQGYVKIARSKGMSESLLLSPQAKKAKIESVFDDLVLGKNDNLEITFLKNMPSPLWLTVGYVSEAIDFVFSENVSVEMVFIEKEVNDQDKMRVFPFNFDLKESAKLDTFFNLRASGSLAIFSQSRTEKNSILRKFCFFGGKSDYKRMDFRCFQKSEGSQISLNGLSFLKGDSVTDYHTDSFHLNKNQKTNQTYKTIGFDKSRNVFGGRIHLTEPSEGAEVDQINRNIILSKKATVDTQPELNIDQDDVVATHGATISSLDEDHFFYLASRGFPKDQAKKLLLDAFCKSALLKDVSKGIHQYFINQVEEDLKNV